MNKKSFSILAALFCCIATYAWQTDTTGSLKFFHNKQLVLEEIGFTDASFSGNPATASTKMFSAQRNVENPKGDFVIALHAELQATEVIPAYSFRIPEAILKDAKLTAFAPGKKGRQKVEIPRKENWILEGVVFLVVEKGGMKFALDLEWTGSSAFQHYRDEACYGTLQRDKDGLLVTLPRKEAPKFGGYYNARITLRTQETDYNRLHGEYQAHYKRNMPVRRFFVFSPRKQRPIVFGGVVMRENDIKVFPKSFAKAIVVPIIYRIPGKYGNGGMNFPRQLKYSANKTENPVYAYAVSGSRKQHEFTMSLPDGYYFLTFHVRDDSTKPYQYSVDVNNIKRTIAVKGSEPAATRFVVKVENGKVNIKFPEAGKKWSLSGISATWIAGIADIDIDVKNMKEFQL